MVPGINTYFQPIQNIQVGGRLAKGQYQYTLQDANLDELYHYAPIMQEKLRGLPGFQDATSDLQIGNLQAIVDIDRDKASQFGITADLVRNTLFSAFGTFLMRTASIARAARAARSFTDSDCSFAENSLVAAKTGPRLVA